MEGARGVRGQGRPGRVIIGVDPGAGPGGGSACGSQGRAFFTRVGREVANAGGPKVK